MPKIMFEGRALGVEPGTRLRDALKAAGLTPHNGQTQWFNCKGFGSCGTCAVRIEGAIHERTRMERWRLDFPPHDMDAGLRLACQVKVGEEDLKVTKYQGFWGHDVSQERSG